jgi:hypothetical protein
MTLSVFRQSALSKVSTSRQFLRETKKEMEGLREAKK